MLSSFTLHFHHHNKHSDRPSRRQIEAERYKEGKRAAIGIAADRMRTGSTSLIHNNTPQSSFFWIPGIGPIPAPFVSLHLSCRFTATQTLRRFRSNIRGAHLFNLKTSYMDALNPEHFKMTVNGFALQKQREARGSDVAWLGIISHGRDFSYGA